MWTVLGWKSKLKTVSGSRSRGGFIIERNSGRTNRGEQVLGEPTPEEHLKRKFRKGDQRGDVGEPLLMLSKNPIKLRLVREKT